jgi:hypothetical protein
MEWAKQMAAEELINIVSIAKPTIHEFMLLIWLKINLGIMWTCL